MKKLIILFTVCLFLVPAYTKESISFRSAEWTPETDNPQDPYDDPNNILGDDPSIGDLLASLVSEVLSQFADAEGNIDTSSPKVQAAIKGIQSSVPAAQQLSQTEYKQVVQAAIQKVNAITQGDPVQTNNGSFTTTETDIHYIYNGNEIKFDRSYTSSNKNKGSLGTGWESSIDESIIFGTLHNIENIYTDYLEKYNQSLREYQDLASEVESIKSNGSQVMDRSEVSSVYERIIGKLEDMYCDLVVLEQLLDNAEIDYSKTLNSIERNKYNYKLGVTRQESNIGCDRIMYRTGTGLTRTFVTTDGVNYQMEGTYGDYTLIKETENQFVLTTPQKQKITFDYWGRKISEEDIKGNLICYEYDPTSGLLKTISDGSNRQLAITRNSNGKITSIEAPEQTVIQYAYNSNGMLSSVVDAKGDAVRYEYNGTLLTKIIKPDDSFLKYEYDNQNRVIYTQDEEGNREYFAYDSALSVTQYTNPAGYVIKHYHDDRFRQIRNEYEDGSEESFFYDDHDNLIKVIDRRGNQTLYTYDERKNKLSQTEPDGYTQKWTYNEFNKVSSYTAKNNSLTMFNYDFQGNLKSVLYPDGSREEWTYDSHGRVISHTDCNGGTEYFEYDSYGNLKQKTDANNNSTLYEYDKLGRLIKSVNPEMRSLQNSYYADGQIKSKTDGYGNTELFEYNNRKDLIKHTDYEGNETLYVYNRKHEVLRIIDAEGIVRGFEYTPDGRVKLEKKGKLLDKYLISNTTDNENEKQLYIMTVGEVIELVESGEADDAVEKRLAFLKNLNSKLNLDDVNDGVAWLIHTSYEYDENGYIIKTKNFETEEEASAKYDSLGNLVWKQDAEGNEEFFEYDSMNRKQSHTDSYGNVEYYRYDKMGNLNWYKDKNGNESSWEYDIMNRLYKITDAENNEMLQTFDSCGRLIVKIDALGNKTEYKYDKCGNLISEKDANGYTTKYGYDKSGLLISVTDARGNSTYKGYDQNGRLISETDADGNSKNYTLNKNGVIISVKDRLENEWIYELDKDGRTVKSTDPYGAETKYEYDISGNVVRLTDALNYAAFSEYDAKGRIISKTDPLQNTEKYEYDKNGNLRYETDAEGRTTEYVYDKLNRLITVVNAGGDCVQYQYDNEKNVTSFIDAKGESYSYEYDGCGRKISETDRLGNVQSFKYDACGRLIWKKDFNGAVTEYEYDKVGKQVQVNYPDSTSKSFAYDKVYNLISAENGIRSYSYSYDKQNRLITSKDNDIGQTVKYEYDAEGRRTKISYIEGKRTQKFIWSKTGKLLSVRDKEGNITVYSYDKNGRETGAEYPNHVKESKKYDAAGRLVMIKAELYGSVLSAESYVYDKSGKRLYTVNEGGKLEAYRYDDNGSISNVYYSFAGGKISNDYEERLGYGLFPEYRSCSDEEDSVLLDFDFPEAIDLNKEELIEAIKNIISSKRDVYEGYYGKKLTGHGIWCVRPEDIEKFVSHMSPSGLERQMLESAMARISSGKGIYGNHSLVWAEHYEYDENGNIASKTNGWGTINYEYDKENRLLKAGNRTFEYDFNGNLIQENLGKLATAYNYNAENRVVDVNTQVQGLIGHWCGWGYWGIYGRQDLKSGVRYEYDAFGRRVTRAEYKTVKDSWYGWQREWTNNSVTESQYDGLSMNVLQEFNDTDYHPNYGMPWAPWFGFTYIRPLWAYYGTFMSGRWDKYVPAGKYKPVSEYVYGNGLVSRSDYDENFAWSGRFTGTEYYTKDMLGSVMMTTDSIGHASNRYDYDAYGTAYTGSFSGRNKIGYNGKQYDNGTGWYNYGFRDYNPQTCRFTSQDPIRDGMNWYAYCGGDPINLIDLYGYNPIAIGLGFGGTIIVVATYISVTQNESYQAAIKEASSAITETVTNINHKINAVSVNVTKQIVETVQNQLSKGKTARDPEGNPIPLDQQSPGPLGKGANAGPEYIGDPGDFGGPEFKPPKDPSPKEKALLAAVAGALLYDNIPDNTLPENDASTKKDKQKNKESEVLLKKGK